MPVLSQRVMTGFLPATYLVSGVICFLSVACKRGYFWFAFISLLLLLP